MKTTKGKSIADFKLKKLSTQSELEKVMGGDTTIGGKTFKQVTHWMITYNTYKLIEDYNWND
jgi:hypothetical protein